MPGMLDWPFGPAEQTGMLTAYGRPVWQGPKGEQYSELTTTIQLSNGKWITVPTVTKDGRVIPEQMLESMFEKNRKDPITGAQIPEFDSLKEAEAYAKTRSARAFVYPEGR